MMREVECKILEVNPTLLMKRLTALGANYKGTKKLVAVHLDTVDKFFSRKRWVVRLRSDGGQATLTIKRGEINKGGIKSLQESEIVLGEFKASLRVLKKMGLKPILRLVKSRTSYELNGVKFEIDKYIGKYAHIPAFLEIEAATRAKVLEAAKKLGYSSKHLKSYDVYDLIRHYSRPGR